MQNFIDLHFLLIGKGVKLYEKYYHLHWSDQTVRSLAFSMSDLIKSSVVFTLISDVCNSTILHSRSCFANVQSHALILLSKGDAVVAIVSGFYSNFNLPPVPRLLKPETL